MSNNSSVKAKQYLEKLNVNLFLDTRVTDYDGKTVTLSNGTTLKARTLVWAAGVIGNKLEGIPTETLLPNNRIKVDRYNKVEGSESIYAIGDIAYMTEEAYPKGHPQVAQPAIQQADNLAKNLKKINPQ